MNTDDWRRKNIRIVDDAHIEYSRLVRQTVRRTRLSRGASDAARGEVDEALRRSRFFRLVQLMHTILDLGIGSRLPHLDDLAGAADGPGALTPRLQALSQIDAARQEIELVAKDAEAVRGGAPASLLDPRNVSVSRVDFHNLVTHLPVVLAYLDEIRADHTRFEARRAPTSRRSSVSWPEDTERYEWELVWGADKGFTWIATNGETFRLEYIQGPAGKQERVQVTGQLEDVLQAIPDRGEFEEAVQALVHRPNRPVRAARGIG